MLLWTLTGVFGLISCRIFHACSCSHFLLLLMTTVVLFTFMPIASESLAANGRILDGHASDVQDTEKQSYQLIWKDPLSRDALFMGSATILGLSAFGSTLVLMINSKYEFSFWLILGITGGLALIIVMSTILMIVACCFASMGTVELLIIIILIGIGAYTTVVVFAVILQRLLKNPKSSNRP